MPLPEPASHLVLDKAAPKRFFGKYRGTVEKNLDPLQIGRIIAIVPDVQSTPLSWALPCTPFPVTGTALLTVPPLGASVWIEFEAGNPDHPIWSGGYWTANQTPLLQTPTS
jgi:hypothetical protein